MTLQLWLIIALAVIGFGISWFIYRKKEKGEKLVCPLRGEDCNKVVQSAYSSMFGVPNEVAGMLYYGAVILLALLLWSGVSSIIGAPLTLLLFVMGLGAGAMSAILTGIQGFIIRSWCVYCLGSAAVNIAIVAIEWTWI